MVTWVKFDDFTKALFEAALFSTNDESDESGGVPLDKNYDISAFDLTALETLAKDCERFQASPAWQAALEDDDPRADRRAAHGCSLEASAGHDFWLTRCGHGAGFWDGDWAEPHAAALTKLSKDFGEVELYLGDDKKIYRF